MTEVEFIRAIAEAAQTLVDAGIPEAHQLARDAGDYLRSPWATEARCIEVLTEEARVLIHEARTQGLEHPALGALVAVCIEAGACRLLADRQHDEFFRRANPARN